MDKDVIYRQDAIDALWKIRRQLQMLDDTHKADRVMHGIYLAKKALEQLPPAPERKTGKWIYHSDWEADGECAYECSECGMGSDVDYDYCMRCGADMREGQDAVN